MPRRNGGPILDVLWNVYLETIFAIGELPMHRRINRKGDRLDGAVAHNEETPTGMCAAEVLNSP
jgi:hypothetical protein